MTDEDRTILRGLRMALLEIRASRNHEGAKILADIFHNVPSMIANESGPAAIMAEVTSQAERHNCAAAVARLFHPPR